MIQTIGPLPCPRPGVAWGDHQFGLEANLASGTSVSARHAQTSGARGWGWGCGGGGRERASDGGSCAMEWKDQNAQDKVNWAFLKFFATINAYR